MIIQVHTHEDKLITVHVPQWLFLNWCTEWITAVGLKYVLHIRIRARDLHALVKVLRQYQKIHEDFRLVEVTAADGSHIAVWL